MTNLKNSVKLIGHLGKDPEVRTFESGKKKAFFTLATTESYRNQKGENVNDTQWHNIVMWGKLADDAGQMLKKGTEVSIEGKLVHRVSWWTASNPHCLTYRNLAVHAGFFCF